MRVEPNPYRGGAIETCLGKSDHKYVFDNGETQGFYLTDPALRPAVGEWIELIGGRIYRVEAVIWTDAGGGYTLTVALSKSVNSIWDIIK